MPKMTKIKKARIIAGYTQTEFAEKVGVSTGSVSQWESGATHPKVKRLKKLSDIRNVPVEELIDDEEKVG